ncbi:MAG: hypothetical protein RLZZ519_3229, partial [Bacteroidota bacterium]
MLKRFFPLLALFFVTTLLPAQINIVGANYDIGTGTINVLRWDANVGTLIDSVATPTQGIAIGSSVFDAYHGIYYFADFNGLNGVDLDSNSYASYPGTDINTSAEIDMSSGRIYGLRSDYVLDSNGVLISSRMDFVEYDIANNTETVKGSFAGNRGAYLDANCFDSNQGIYYF